MYKTQSYVHTQYIPHIQMLRTGEMKSRSRKICTRMTSCTTSLKKCARKISMTSCIESLSLLLTVSFSLLSEQNKYTCSYVIILLTACDFILDSNTLKLLTLHCLTMNIKFCSFLQLTLDTCTQGHVQ